MNVQLDDQSSPSWFSITCVVVIVHSLLIGFSLFFDAHPTTRQQPAPRLVVQTVNLAPSTTVSVKASTELALTPSPIPRSPLPPNPIPKTPLLPTPLERKTMPKREEQIKIAPPPRAPEVPPRPAPTEPPAQPEPVQPPTPKPNKIVTPPQPKPKSTASQKAKPQPQKAPKKTTKPKEVKPVPKQPAKKTPTPQKTPAPAKENDKKAAEKKAAEEDKRKQEAEQEAEQEAQKKKAELERQQTLLASAQEKMAKVSTVRKQSTEKHGASLTSTPSAITQLQIDALPTAKGAPALGYKEMSYRDELAGRLKLLLRLPEYGEIKINLTLNRSGKVMKLAIASAESAANRKYIEKTLPTLSFPAFGANFESSSEYTFAITLSNES